MQELEDLLQESIQFETGMGMGSSGTAHVGDSGVPRMINTRRQSVGQDPTRSLRGSIQRPLPGGPSLQATINMSAIPMEES